MLVTSFSGLRHSCCNRTLSNQGLCNLLELLQEGAPHSIRVIVKLLISATTAATVTIAFEQLSISLCSA